METPPRLPIIPTALGAWTDGFRAIAAMPALLAIGFLLHALIALGVFIVVELIFLNPARSVMQWLASPAGFLFGIVKSSLQIVLLAPLAMAVHRYVVLGEAVARYPLHPLRPSYLRYIGTALALNLAYRCADLINLVAPPIKALPYAANVALALATFAIMIVVAIIAVRRIALFPAIAVRAPHATWSETAPVDAGNVGRILLVLMLVGVPAMLVMWGLHLILPVPNWAHGSGVLVPAMVMTAVQTIVLCVLAAGMARIYMAIGVSSLELADLRARPVLAGGRA